MDFAKEQLKKYGWKEGQGLGKDERGIVNPIRVGIKRDHAGVGALPGEEFTSDWWSTLFNKAAKNISVTNSQGDVQIESSTGDCDSACTMKQKHYDRHRSSLLYGGFLGSTHSFDQGEQSSKEKEKGAVKRKRKKRERSESYDDDDVTINGKSGYCRLSDDDLVKACEGRTGHKAARHGLELSGKLKRIKEQEQFQSPLVSQSHARQSNKKVKHQHWDKSNDKCCVR